MKLAKDEFGNEIHEGDIVVSAASSTGNLKIGTAYYQKSGALWINHIIEAGWYWSKRKWNSEAKEYEDNPKPIKSAAGSNVLLLKRADGSLTELVERLMGNAQD